MALHQVSRRCQYARTLEELDGLLITVVERIFAFDRGFLTYQLRSGDWRFVMSPSGTQWDRHLLRDLLQTTMQTLDPIVVHDSARDPRLGHAHGSRDGRLLFPLRVEGVLIGALFLSSSAPFSEQMLDFVGLFVDIAGLALANATSA